MIEPKLPTPRRKRSSDHSVSFRAWFVQGEASGHGIYVLPVIVLIVATIKYLL